MTSFFISLEAVFFSSVFSFLISLIKLLISTEPFSWLLQIYILSINSRWFVILKIHLLVSTSKPKMAVCGDNSGDNRFKSVAKNILSWLHNWLTRTHSQNKCAAVSSFEWQMEYEGESIFPKIYSFLFRYSMLWSILYWKLRW